MAEEKVQKEIAKKEAHESKKTDDSKLKTGKATPEKRPKSEKKAKKEKKKSSYKISRSPEAVKMSREKSRLEKKKGKFRRHNTGKKVRVPDAWRRSQGIDSGQRKREKAKPPVPNSGYMTPQKVKGLHRTGYLPVRVFNTSGLSGVDSKKQAIVIASTVGKKKRAEIQKVAQEKKIQILNFKE